MSARHRSRLDALRLSTDPLQHAALAAAVVAPLVPRLGRRVLSTAIVASLVIDVDHAIAARSIRVGAMTSLPARPRTHSLPAAAGAGGLVGASAGPAHGWATFGGLVSHLLHDAGDRSAPTPLLWPFAPAEQIGRRRQLAATVALALASAAISRVAAGSSSTRSAAGAGAAAAPPRRTA